MNLGLNLKLDTAFAGEVLLSENKIVFPPVRGIQKNNFEIF